MLEKISLIRELIEVTEERGIYQGFTKKGVCILIDYLCASWIIISHMWHIFYVRVNILLLLK